MWGIGDLGDKRLGVSDIRAKVTVEGDASADELDDIVAHATHWSPVANTMINPVALSVTRG